MKSFKSVLIIALLSLVSPAVFSVTELQKSAVKAALKINDWDKAMDLAEDLVDDFPQSSMAHFLLASAIRIKMQQVSQVRAMFSLGDYKEALAKAIELDPKNLDARTEEIGFYLFAPSIAGGDKDFAIARISELKTVDAFSAKQMEVQLAASNKDLAMQEQLLQELSVMKPDDPNTLMSLAGFEFERQAYDAADALLLRINGVLDPGWPLAAKYQRAKWRVLAKQESDVAIALLQDYQQQLPFVQSEVSMPSVAAALWRMAQAYENKGDKNKAIELLKASLKLDKKFELAEKDLARLID